MTDENRKFGNDTYLDQKPCRFHKTILILSQNHGKYILNALLLFQQVLIKCIGFSEDICSKKIISG